MNMVWGWDENFTRGHSVILCVLLTIMQSIVVYEVMEGGVGFV